jgi:hypothetical protein
VKTVAAAMVEEVVVVVVVVVGINYRIYVVSSCT